MTQPAIVVLGNGQAGFQVAASLRDGGYDGEIVVLGDESHLPYHRPPLSKAYLLGSVEDAGLAMRPTAYYAEKRIDMRTNSRAKAIDRARKVVSLEDGSEIEYSHLVFAVGARNRPLPVPGADLGGVYFLRTLDEAHALRQRINTAKKVAVIGAGFIGLEFAAAANHSGAKVTVIDVLDRPMARALSPQMASIYTREHTKRGVDLLFNTQVAKLNGVNGQVQSVETTDGRVIEAELVVIGIGVIPNSEIAEAAGLEVRNGIVVNEHLLTSDPNISAIGDVAAHPNPFADGNYVRIESIQNASDQARAVAARLTGKAVAPYGAAPWFWSDQADLKLQIAGLTTGFDKIVLRGDPEGTSCAMYLFLGERLLGVETINRPGDHMTARRLLATRVTVTAEQAADESFDLKQLVQPAKA
ncbi:MAG: FAD-dependent pyridine nucleotide-disulfide oxidoreductase [Verrucomicrobiaceae bacterium]|nr:FAD-dependent pyridine nucleotide-disulfide oxidoreductase [Verrucomicrobiaceae bacterium]